MKLYVLIIGIIITTNLTAQTYTWTGNADGVSLFNIGNWSDNENPPPQIDKNTPITFNLLINNGTVGGSSGFNGSLLLGGNTLTIHGGSLIGDRIESFTPSTGQKSTLEAFGGTITTNKLVDLNIDLKNDTHITLNSATDPLQGSTISIDPDYSGILFLKNISADFVRNNYLSNITVGSSPAVEDDNIFISETGEETLIKLFPGNGNKSYADTPKPNNGPNIIYILLDDLGYGDLGNFWQNLRTGNKKMATPQLDKMANEGAMLTHHYTAAPVCAPSRASFLEGLSQGHSSVRNNQFDKASKNSLTLAQMLSKSGYRTMHVGKNGTAGPRNSGLPAHPLKRGFEQFYGFLYHNQGHIHYPQNGTTGKESFFTDGYTKILEGTDLTYTTDVFTAKSKQWIVEHESKRPEQPFFLYLAYDVPHTALETPTQVYPSGRGLNGGLQWTSSTSPTPWVNTASGIPNSYIHPDYATTSWTDNEKKFATMIRRVDNAVEDIIQLLKDLNIDNETLIVFSSDNGPHSSNGVGQAFQSYANLNGIKRDMWEGGIKMPTIARYPGVIPANSTVTFPSGQWDWFATFAELAQVSIPIYTDGTSLVPSLKQDNTNQKDKGYIYLEYQNNGSTPNYSDFEASKRLRRRNQMQVIRMGDYKGVRYNIQRHSDYFEIYDVVNDERETTNLASTMTELQQKMLDRVLQVRTNESTASRPYDNELIPSIPISGLSSGLAKSVFIGEADWVPNFEFLTPISNEETLGIDLSTGGLTSNFGISHSGFLDIPVDGTYTFYLKSASKCHVMIHDIHALDNDFEFTPSEVSTTLHLKAGKHPIRIYYQQNDNITPALDLKISSSEISKTSIPNSMYFKKNTLSIQNVKPLKFNLKIYPNPVKDTLMGSITSLEKATYTANIYNISGQKVYTNEAGTNVNAGMNNVNISVSKLNSGYYFLLLKFDINNEVLIKKFIKK